MTIDSDLVPHPVSPLELMLPQGVSQSAVALGGECPPALLPALYAADHASAIDLLILAPSDSERNDPAWLEEAAMRVSGLADDGVVYVLFAGAQRLRDLLVRAGLLEECVVLHVPDRRRSRYLIPIGSAAAKYALSGPVPAKRRNRLFARYGLGLPRIARRAPTGVIYRRQGAAPLARWAFELKGQPSTSPSVFVSRSWRPGRAIVVWCFSGEQPTPDFIAKVSPRGDEEWAALLQIAPAAASAGIRVPNVIATGTLGEASVAVESYVDGVIARQTIAEGLLSGHAVVELIVAWLQRWGSSEMTRRPVSRSDLVRYVLAPADLMRDALGEQDLAPVARRLAARLEGTVVPRVPVHNDLTAWNVLIDARGQLGVVDWEGARTDGLPLTDFYYAVADVLADSSDDDGRVRSFEACFAPWGEHRDFTMSLGRRLESTLGVSPELRQLCFLNTWLHHAAEEVSATHPDGRGPFARIARLIARDPRTFLPEQAA
jgi:hypothetical protein